MSVYYRHVSHGDGFAEDEEGVELASLDAARAKAIDGLRDIMAGELRRGELNMGSFIEIEDERHHLAMTVLCADAVIVAGGNPKPRRLRAAS